MKRTLEVHNSTLNSQPAAFTLLELLVILAVCALLGLLLLPARAGSRSRAQSVRCLDNLHQVMGAMLMYTHDNHDLFPPNPDDGTAMVGYSWCVSRANGGMPGDPAGAQTFNPDLLADGSLCLVAPYLQSNVTVFRCTADPRLGTYQGTNTALIGKIVPAARSLSLSCAVGTVDPAYAAGPYYNHHSGVPNLPTNGDWLTGTHGGNKHNIPYRTYGSLSDLVIPAPANLLVVTEEDPFSINDGCFATMVGTPAWLNFPSTRHNMGAVVSFADGHVELHKWLSASPRLTQSPSKGTLTRVSPLDPDWTWVTQHTTARAN